QARHDITDALDNSFLETLIHRVCSSQTRNEVVKTLIQVIGVWGKTSQPPGYPRGQVCQRFISLSPETFQSRLSVLTDVEIDIAWSGRPRPTPRNFYHFTSLPIPESVSRHGYSGSVPTRSQSPPPKSDGSSPKLICPVRTR